MTEHAPEICTEYCVSRIFEIVQAMSGQGNTITIPCPYLDFFAGDRQQHLLAAILNQLVFWSSGKSSLQEGWFYKEHAVLAKEVRASSEDVIRKAMSKIIDQYLPGVIEEEKRKVNGTPKMHYRINEEALIARIFPPSGAESVAQISRNGSQAESAEILDPALKPNGNGVIAESEEPAQTVDSAFKPNGNGSQAECKRLLSRMETAHEPNPGNGSQAESILYTDLNNRSLHTDLKTTRMKNSPVDNFSVSVPETNISDATEDSNLATEEDFDLAMWFWSIIIELYERAAEYDGTLAKPKEPNFVGWANEVRLLRQEHGCTYGQIRNMIERIQHDPFWCPRIQSIRTLRSKWPDLVLKLCSGNLSSRVDPFGTSFKCDDSIPRGFVGNKN
ncbi:TPA: hypothetical protein ACOEHG_000888 [Enterobacter ludwigii]|uniref:hypothetical protein n=1 Tax=Enterobacter ludwigii TaxID=299767 RepID=UPI003B61053A